MGTSWTMFTSLLFKPLNINSRDEETNVLRPDIFNNHMPDARVFLLVTGAILVHLPGSTKSQLMKHQKSRN
ncbi:hypothetical protein VNO77_20277 [Canavalia gladiata]|uniref:Uncharacterized protein n=1 Tax=Canavalia gladiata TaxID=3824 RepID=A0AAN9LP80_CANGL